MKAVNVVNLEEMKRINQAIFLHTIFRKREISRAQLAMLTGLGPATVSVLIQELLDMEMLVEAKEVKSTGPRENVPLQINPYGGYICTVDVAAQNITYALFNMQLEKLDEIIVGNSEETVLQQLFESLVSHIDRLLDKGREVQEKLIGIAVSIPREQNPVGQKVLLDTGVSADRMNLDMALRFIYGKPIFIAPAVHSRAIAEYYLGAAKNVEEFIFIDISEELEMIVVQKGKVVNIPFWAENDLKHIAIDRKGPKCSCGKQGCLEAFLTTRSILKRVKKSRTGQPEAGTCRMPDTYEEPINLEQINQWANEGDPAVQKIIMEAADALCIGIHHMISLIQIPNVVIAGKVSRIHFFFRTLSEVWANYTMFQNRFAYIHITFLAQEEANLGSGAMVLNHYLETDFIKNKLTNLNPIQRRYNYN